MVWNADTGAVVRQLRGGHWVNTLALSSGTRFEPGRTITRRKSPGMTDRQGQGSGAVQGGDRGKGERIISGSDDFTMFMWTPGTSKQPLQHDGSRSAHNHVLFSRTGGGWRPRVSTRL